VEERHKPAMVEAGRWRATRPEVRGHAGFRLNALVSLLANASWAKLAAEFLAAKQDSEELRVFVNTVLAQGWREAGEELDEAALAARTEPFGLDPIPPEALVVTAGVDVQDDRLECSIVGWARDGTAFVLAHVVLWGSTLDNTLWAELDAVLKTRWRHPLGGSIGVDAAAVDAGDGDHYDRVLAFCAPRMARRIVATKGAPGSRPAIAVSQAKLRGGARLFIAGVDGLRARFSRGCRAGAASASARR
jgi:phage terminase large subunit GpA-like protein